MNGAVLRAVVDAQPLLAITRQHQRMRMPERIALPPEISTECGLRARSSAIEDELRLP